MNRKALMSFCILTVLAILFVSFLLITVGPARSQAVNHCKIFPADTAARLENCANCGSGDKEAYCPKNDCNCANSQCSYWYQTPGLCTDIKVCGAVCNDQNAMPYCSITLTGGAGAGATDGRLPDGTIIPGPCPPGSICGTSSPSSALNGPCSYNPNNLPASDLNCTGYYNGTLICCNPAGGTKLGKGKCFYPVDVNRDCKIDIIDIAVVAKKYGKVAT